MNGAHQAIELLFFRWAFIAFSMTCLLYVVYIGLEKKIIARIAMISMACGLALHTAALVARTVHSKHLPLTNMFEYVSLFAWFATCFYFVYLKIYKNQVLGAFISFTVFMLVVSGSLLPKDANMQLVPALQSYWLQIHVSVASLGEAAFLVAFAVNIMYLLKTGLSSSSRFAARLPDTKTLDIIAYKAISIGYPLFTIGALFAGAIWAEQAWGSFWSWDPKEVGSLIVWLVYSAYLHARFVKGWTGLRATVLSMAGFICSLLTFFANLILGGLHSYG